MQMSHINVGFAGVQMPAGPRVQMMYVAHACWKMVEGVTTFDWICYQDDAACTGAKLVTAPNEHGPKFPTSGRGHQDRASGLGFPHRFPMFGESH